MVTKICKCCGDEKPVSEFKANRRSKDGYRNICNACLQTTLKAKSSIEAIYHKDLSAFAPRMLMEHLKALGYEGQLTIPHIIEL